jgi:hypothetical protein
MLFLIKNLTGHSFYPAVAGWSFHLISKEILCNPLYNELLQ